MAREFRRGLCVVLVACLLGDTFCAPSPVFRLRRDQYRPYRDVYNENSNDLVGSNSQLSSTSDPFDDDDDDDDWGTMQTTSGGGSSIFSLLNLVSALFPSSSGTSNRVVRDMLRHYIRRYQQQVNIRKKDVADNIIEVDYVKELTPPFQRQEDDDDDSDSHDEHDDDKDDENSESEESNDAAEESVENNQNEGNDKASKQDSNGDAGSEEDNDSDYDEPEGDDGGILGLLAKLSGGDEGSDLGTLLATVSQIVGNLSGGEGFDLNSLIASGIGLFVGLLSQGEENPGEVIAGWLLSSLDALTGGGAQNNGAFFGKFLTTLVKGVSAAETESGESSEESEGKMKMADSTGFFVSLLTSLSGDMSKGSSGGSMHPW